MLKVFCFFLGLLLEPLVLIIGINVLLDSHIVPTFRTWVGAACVMCALRGNITRVYENKAS